MREKITKEDGFLVIRIPLKTKRFNPYSDESFGSMDNICGVIAGDEMGFAHWIDMSYKGKGDQVGGIFYDYYGEPDDFKKMCDDLGIDIVEYPICAVCRDTLYGTFEINDDGKYICSECMERNNLEDN